jgi:hypothetical protein
MCNSGSGWATLAVGAVDGTAGYPRTAKFLQLGGRFDSEGVALARIHIPQLSERPCGAGLVLARASKGKVAVWTGRLCATQRAGWRVCELGITAASGGHWVGRVV